jgi:signal transduction histidine kinase
MRIRNRLLILVLAVLVPAFLVAAAGIGYVFYEEQKLHRQSMRETTRALAIVLDRELATREGILQSLASSPALSQGDLQAFHNHARVIASNWDTAIILTDLSGQQLINTRQPFGAKNLPKTATQMELRQSAGPDVAVISNLYFAPVGKSYSFSIQLPVKRDGRAIYYIGMGSFVGQLQSVFREQKMPPEWTGTILDRNGVVIARSHDAEKYVGKHVGDERFRKLQASAEGFHESLTLDGVPVVTFYNRVPKSGWTFLIAVPQSGIYRAAINAAAYAGAIALLLLSLAVIGALAVARKTARPIESLRLSAQRLGHGEIVQAQHSNILEVDAVSIEMARASAKINSVKAELEQRVATAVAAVERSQQALIQGQKLEALGRLTGGIAHDFNNVLQTLSTGLQLVKLNSTDPRNKSTLETCQRAIKRAAELTGQLLAFGRVQDARLETVDVAQQIADVVPLLKGALRSDIIIRLEVDDHLWPVSMDPLQFELALLNLSINARDAMPHGGHILLKAENDTVTGGIDELSPGDYVRICLIDTGHGMSDEVRSKAMDPFFTTKSIGMGSGMGLPQAYGFARQSGGTLLLQGEPDKGTTVVLYLPKSGNLPQPRTDHPAVIDHAVSSGVILFVEDDALVRETVGPALQASGFQVVVAKNGDEAVMRLESGEHFDLVFSDIVMPGTVNGIDLAELIRTRFPQTRIVLATGYSERRVALPGVRTLPKPYGVAEMLDALNEELQA